MAACHPSTLGWKWSSISMRLCLVLKQLEGYSRMDLVILNKSQMTRTTPELAPPLHTSAPGQREDVWAPTYDLTFNIHGASSVESSFEPSGREVETLTLGHRGPVHL
ncbi:hypothetical protein AVEN_55199-1 [Araneus ventricosus]|uniref:Uncharacterized protein n=1 Tax=Araneus ventricosus TaxID=182803 RepID=A0A4Y2G8F3_ARAVE|nr:hypothetical protein AVEN_55199-1 [Araneus ventricosus]